jgi:hypothetical protein
MLMTHLAWDELVLCTGRRAGYRGGNLILSGPSRHPFGGLLLTSEHGRSALAMCDCGAVLGRAKAVFATCSECNGTGDRRTDVTCQRCGGSGEEVDHAALERQRADDETEGATW